MAEPKPRVRLPKSVAAGVPFTIKTRITHPMHTGLRRDRDGKIVPRHIINHFVARYNGAVVISVDLEPAVSADPYIQFVMAAPEDGLLEFEWVDDDGAVFSLQRRIVVE